MQGTFAALQLFAAFFLSLWGLATTFGSHDASERAVGAFLGAIGLTFLALVAVNLKKRT